MDWSLVGINPGFNCIFDKVAHNPQHNTFHSWLPEPAHAFLNSQVGYTEASTHLAVFISLPLRRCILYFVIGLYVPVLIRTGEFVILPHKMNRRPGGS